jgi:hypothetical protein
MALGSTTGSGATSVILSEINLGDVPVQSDDVESIGDSQSNFEGTGGSDRGGVEVESGEATSSGTMRQSNEDNTLCCRLDTAVMLVIGLVCIGAMAGATVDQPAAGAACGAGLGLLFLCCLCAGSARNTPAARHGATAAATPAGQAFYSGPNTAVQPHDSGYGRC